MPDRGWRRRCRSARIAPSTSVFFSRRLPSGHCGLATEHADLDGPLHATSKPAAAKTEKTITSVRYGSKLMHWLTFAQSPLPSLLHADVATGQRAGSAPDERPVSPQAVSYT